MVIFATHIEDTESESDIKQGIMKKGIHPENYRLVAFKDMSNEHIFITRSSAASKEMIEIEGVDYPLLKGKYQKPRLRFNKEKLKLFKKTGGGMERGWGGKRCKVRVINRR